jgi:hypothetical protein
VEAAREAAAWATTMPVLASWANCRLGYARALRGTGEAGRTKALMAAADLLVDLGAPLPAPWPKGLPPAPAGASAQAWEELALRLAAEGAPAVVLEVG